MCPHTYVCKQVNTVVKLFNNDIDPDDMLDLDRRQNLVQSVETANLEVPAADLVFNGDVEEANRLEYSTYRWVPVRHAGFTTRVGVWKVVEAHEEKN